MRQRLSKLGRLAGLDSQVLPTLLLRSWQIIAGGVMVLLIPLWLSKVEQGYYYTFSSLLALQVFFELGMNQVIVQLVSHDFAHLSVASGAGINGDAIRIARLASLVGLLRRWYSIAASLFFVVVSACGAWFFFTRGNLPISAWGGAWLILTLVTAANLYLSAPLAVLEGCGEMAGVARMRLVQAVCGSGLMWIALTFGVGLWAMPLVPMAAAAYTAYWLRINGTTIKLLRHHSAVNANTVKINWRADIFPFQWRIAVSSFSGYFIFQLFTPLAFARVGAVEAGRLGITMTMFSALLTVGMSWVNAKLPTFAAHVSRNERVSLNLIFRSVLKRSMVFTLAGVITMMMVMEFLIAMDVAIAQRFASIPVFACLSIVTLANCLIFAEAAYMRAHKEEPMMLPSVVVGLLILVGSTIASSYGVTSMMVTYALVTAGVGLPWTYFLYRRYRH